MTIFSVFFTRFVAVFSRCSFFLFWWASVVSLAAAIGSVVAFFLWALNKVTQCRFDHPGLLFFLPLAGLGIGVVYHYWGKSIEEGNNLILEQIHEPGGGVPRRMAPVILGVTLVTHLFGGSVGREGTAVQIGGSMASAWARRLKLSPKQTKVLLTSGVAAGFGAVFGTPFAGAFFSLEVLTTGLSFYQVGLFSSLLAALFGDLTCRAWGVERALYQLPSFSHHALILSPALLCKAALLGIAVGCVARAFVVLEHTLHQGIKKVVPYAPWRPVVGGMIIIALVALLRTRSYLGLGEWSPNPHDVTIATLFQSPSAPPLAWAWKLLFTAVTLSSGFKGGEVTPLFFIGAALGNTLALLLGIPFDFFTALGFVAIFAGASNTPFACTVMGLELFGISSILPMAIACFCSYAFSGHSGIYRAQRH